LLGVAGMGLGVLGGLFGPYGGHLDAQPSFQSQDEPAEHGGDQRSGTGRESRPWPLGDERDRDERDRQDGGEHCQDANGVQATTVTDGGHGRHRTFLYGTKRTSHAGAASAFRRTRVVRPPTPTTPP